MVQAFRSEAAAGKAAGDVTGLPQRWQKWASEDTCASQRAQVRCATPAPQALQKFPEAAAPHRGQDRVVDSPMRPEA